MDTNGHYFRVHSCPFCVTYVTSVHCWCPFVSILAEMVSTLVSIGVHLCIRPGQRRIPERVRTPAARVRGVTDCESPMVCSAHYARHIAQKPDHQWLDSMRKSSRSSPVQMMSYRLSWTHSVQALHSGGNGLRQRHPRTGGPHPMPAEIRYKGHGSRLRWFAKFS